MAEKPVRYEGGFIVGGRPDARVAPNFRIEEFRRPDGSIRMHRETVSALQILRVRFGRSISIRSVSAEGGMGAAADGLFAWIAGEPLDELTQHAMLLRERGIFQAVEPQPDRLFVTIGDPQRLPPVPADEAMESNVQITAGFETSGDPFQQVTGNFDGAGLSFGPSQVNFGTGTLVPLFRRFQTSQEAALRACFGPDYEPWLEILEQPRAAQVAWADSMSRGVRKADFAEPWKGYLQAVGRVAEFRLIMTEFSKEKYGAQLTRALQWLFELRPIQVDWLPCISALYDLCTQQGSLDRAHEQIQERVEAEAPNDQLALVRIAVEERGKTASPEWRADCLSRRLGILNRELTPVVHEGRAAARDNPNFYLLRDVSVTNLESLGL